YKWKPTERTFTLVGNAQPLTMITATNKVPLKVPIPLKVVAPKHVVTRVYTRRPKVPKFVPNSKAKVAKSMTVNRMEPDTSRESDTSVAPSSSSLIDCREEEDGATEVSDSRDVSGFIMLTVIDFATLALLLGTNLGFDPLALVEGFSPIEENKGLLRTLGMLLDDAAVSANQTVFLLLIGVTTTNFSLGCTI
nr:hypothetical protein [Tanacetum cinerariifolium]